MRSRLLALVAPAILCSTALNAQSNAPSEPIGCWTIRLVPGDAGPAGWGLANRPSGQADPAQWGRVHHPPEIVQVSRTRVANEARFDVRSADEHYNRRSSVRVAMDSMVIAWTDGLAGVELRGVVEDSIYRGTAHIITDVVTQRPLPNAGFEGARVVCPAYRLGNR